MTQVGPLPFAKILDLPIILILFTIFLATLGCPLHIFPLFLVSFITIPKSVIEVLDHLGW